MLPMRTTPPFRADHVGSLLRPASVLAARDDFAAGQITAQQLRAVEDAAIADVVAMQQNAGLQSATDGEFPGPPGTWTSSTRSAGSARHRATWR